MICYIVGLQFISVSICKHVMVTCSYRLVKEGESSVDPVQLPTDHEAAIMSGVNVVPPPPRQKKRTSSFGKSSSSSRLLRSASKEQAASTSSSKEQQPSEMMGQGMSVGR